MKFLHLAFVLYIFPFLSYSQIFDWTQQANYPGTARYEAVSFVIADTAYVGTGKNGSTYYNDFYKYDPVNNVWSAITDLPGEVRSGAVAFTINGKGYVGTGSNDITGKLNDFYEYNPITGQWIAVADFIGSARRSAVGFAINGKGYVGTGRDDSSVTGDFYKYDPTLNTWIAVASLSASRERQSASGFSINGKGYVASGIEAGVGGTTIFSDIRSYDPVSDLWTEEIFADLKLNKKQDASVFVLDNKAYMVAGNGNVTTLVYDPTNNSLVESVPFGSATEDNRVGSVAFAIGEAGFVATGYYAPDFVTSTYKNDLWKYESDGPKAPILLHNVTSYENSSINIRIDYKLHDVLSGDSIFTERRLNGGEWELVRINVIAGNTCCFANYYQYPYELDSVAIRSINVRNGIKSSYSKALIVKDIIKPPKVENEEFSENYIKLKITDNSKVEDGYILYKKELFANTYTVLDTLWNNVDYDDFESKFNFVDTNVTPSTTYRYAVKAFKSNKYSDLSEYLITASKTGKWTKQAYLRLDTIDFIRGTYNDGAIYLANYGSNLIRVVSIADGGYSQITNGPFVDVNGVILKSLQNKIIALDNSAVTTAQAKKAWIYDPLTNIWSAIADNPSTAFPNLIGKDEFNGKMYMQFDSEIWEYDISSDVWNLINGSYSFDTASQKFFSNGFLFSKRVSYPSQGNTVFVDKIDVSTGLVTSFTENQFLSIRPNVLNISSDSVLIAGGFYEDYVDGKLIKLGFNRNVLSYNPVTSKYTKISDYNGTPSTGNLFLYQDTLYYGPTHDQFYNSQLHEVWKYNPNAAAPAFNFKVDSVSHQIIKLSWLKGSPDTQGFKLYRKDSINASYNLIATLNQNQLSYLDQGLKIYKEYFYKITGIEGSEESVEKFVSITTIAQNAGLSWFGVAGYTPDSLKLTWLFKNNAPIDSIYILDSLGAEIARLGQDVDALYVNGLSEGESRKFSIYAKNQFGIGDTLTQRGYSRLNAPTFVGVYREGNKYLIKWIDNSAKETFYHITRQFYNNSDTTTFSYAAVEKDSEGFFFEFDDQQSSLSRIDIMARNTNISSLSVSTNINSISQYTAPVDVLGLSLVEIESDFVTVKWDSILDDYTDSVRILIDTYQSQVSKDSISEYTVENLIENSFYTITVQNTNPLLVGNSSTLGFTTKLVAPQINVIAITGGGRIEWVDNSNAEENYIVERALALDSIFIQITSLPANSITFLDTEVEMFTNYVYRVKAITTTNTSNYSNLVGINNAILSIQKNALSQLIEVYPNPATSFLSLNIEGYKIKSASIIAVDGSVMISKRSFNKSEVDVSGLPAGIYTLKIETKEGLDGIVKFIKK